MIINVFLCFRILFLGVEQFSDSLCCLIRYVCIYVCPVWRPAARPKGGQPAAKQDTHIYKRSVLSGKESYLTV